MSETVKPVGVTGAEYRRQWNRLNRDRMRAARRRWLLSHPEKKRPFPRDRLKQYGQKARASYYGGWQRAKNRRTKWTIDETNMLMSFQGTDRELAALLNRSVKAIQMRRHRLGIGPSLYVKGMKAFSFEALNG